MTLRLKVYMGPNDQMANKLVETIYNFIGVVAHDLNCAQILSTFSNLKLKRSVETRSFIVKLFIRNLFHCNGVMTLRIKILGLLSCNG